MLLTNRFLSYLTGTQVSVNTKLDQQNVVAGELLTGRVWLQNMSTKETLLKNIQISFISSYQRPLNFRIDKESILIFKALLRDKIVLSPYETCEMPFEFPTPLYMPTSPASAIVKTKLDIYPLQTLEDCDELVILPPAKVKELFDVFWELGFKHTALSGYLERHLRQPLQIFSIKPIIEPYLGKVKDLEFFYEITTEYIEIFMTIDKMTKELLGMSGEYDEKNNSKVKFKIMLYEEITTKLLSHYIDEMIKISR